MYGLTAEKNCFVFLSGILNSLPKTPEDNDETIIILKRPRFCAAKMRMDVDCFQVIINKSDTYKLINSGCSGMTLSVYGDLRIENETELHIIAEKIEFLETPNSNQETGGFTHIEKRKQIKDDFYLTIH